VHPFGAGTAVACLLTTISFAGIPLAARFAAGSGGLVSIASVATGCAVMAAGLSWLHGPLQLSVLPWPLVRRRRPPQAASL